MISPTGMRRALLEGVALVFLALVALALAGLLGWLLRGAWGNCPNF